MTDEVRYSPAFARARRHRNIGLGLFGILLGLVDLGAAAYALRHNELVTMGAPGRVRLPPSLVIVMGVLILASSVWIMLKKRD